MSSASASGSVNSIIRRPPPSKSTSPQQLGGDRDRQDMAFVVGVFALLDVLLEGAPEDKAEKTEKAQASEEEDGPISAPDPQAPPAP